jgi:hypothetical protein
VRRHSPGSTPSGVDCVDASLDHSGVQKGTDDKIVGATNAAGSADVQT